MIYWAIAEKKNDLFRQIVCLFTGVQGHVNSKGQFAHIYRQTQDDLKNT